MSARPSGRAGARGLRQAVALLLGLAATGAVVAAPWRPASDAEVVETLRDRAADPARDDWRALRRDWRARPDDAATAARFVRASIELARRDGDPRFLGAAEAALAPWAGQRAAPRPLRLLLAVLSQANHDFDGALGLLDVVLAEAPGDGQARLVRASVLQVQGRYDEAAADLDLLAANPATAVWGKVARADLADLRGERRPADPSARDALRALAPGWIVLLDAEAAERHGDGARAERGYREALAAGADAYTLGAYADFLLDAGRPGDAARLLDDHRRVDALLLRLGIAWRALGDARWTTARDDLGDRFDAARLRGDRVHQREEARYRLALADDATGALALARANWRVQREPADLRLLIDAARACAGCEGAAAARDDALGFVASRRLVDVRVARALGGGAGAVASGTGTIAGSGAGSGSGTGIIASASAGASGRAAP